MKKGWQFTKTNEPLKLVKMEIPKAKPGEVILRTGACGICHTDVGVLHDEGWLSIMNVPLLWDMNVRELLLRFESVTEFKVGDRVAVCPTGPSGKGAPGFRYDGGFGTHMKAVAADLVKVPKGLTMAECFCN